MLFGKNIKFVTIMYSFTNLLKISLKFKLLHLNEPTTLLKNVKYLPKCSFCSSSNFGVCEEAAADKASEIATEYDSSTSHTENASSIITEVIDCDSNKLSSDEITLPSVCKPKIPPRNAFQCFEDGIKKNKKSLVPHFIDDMAPPLPISFNLAAFANRSVTLQKLIELGVDLSRIEQNEEKAKFIMRLDFESDMKQHIRFLHDIGVPADELGTFITKNPLIFQEDLNNLQIRVNYLLSKRFSKASIARIVTKNPFYLSTDTKTVDARLGFYQNTFSLNGNEVRFVITKYPKLVTHSFDKLREILFSVKEEMGFSQSEMKALLLDKPKIYTLGRRSLKERFDIVHNQMGISHDMIMKFPGILLTRRFIIEQRHKYLVKLCRAEYDPSKPGYVSLMDLATLSDSEFCLKCAKTSVSEFNNFLKTL